MAARRRACADGCPRCASRGRSRIVASLLGLALMASTVTAERTLRGTSGKDLLLGDSAPNVISGGRSADHLYGRAGNDFDPRRDGARPDRRRQR